MFSLSLVICCFWCMCDAPTCPPSGTAAGITTRRDWHRSPPGHQDHIVSEEKLPPVESHPLPLMDNGGAAAQFLELDNKSSWYIELSPASIPVFIGCSLSLQLSAWGGAVNDVFVLRSPFVLSWFLEQRKQVWNLLYPAQSKINGRHPSF